jgi:hypothetical protein
VFRSLSFGVKTADNGQLQTMVSVRTRCETMFQIAHQRSAFDSCERAPVLGLNEFLLEQSFIADSFLSHILRQRSDAAARANPGPYNEDVKA